jgi:hypothetical protein
MHPPYRLQSIEAAGKLRILLRQGLSTAPAAANAARDARHL